MTRDQMTAYLNLKGWVPASHENVWFGAYHHDYGLVYMAGEDPTQHDFDSDGTLYAKGWDVKHLSDNGAEILSFTWQQISDQDIFALFNSTERHTK